MNFLVIPDGPLVCPLNRPRLFSSGYVKSYDQEGVLKLNKMHDLVLMQHTLMHNGILNLGGTIGGALLTGVSSALRWLSPSNYAAARNFLLDNLNRVVDEAAEKNCHGGNPIGQGSLCETIKNLKQGTEMVNDLFTFCEFQGLSRDGTGLGPTNLLCKENGKNKKLPGWALDFLSNPEHLVTFTGGGSSISMTYGIEQSKGASQGVDYDTSEATSYSTDNGLCMGIFRMRRRLEASNRDQLLLEMDPSGRRRLDTGAAPQAKGDEGPEPEKPEGEAKSEESQDKPAGCRRRRLGAKVNFGWGSNTEGSLSVNMAHGASRGESMQHAIGLTFSDPDATDIFAVKITADPQFGTPIFRTMVSSSGQMLLHGRVMPQFLNLAFCNIVCRKK